MRSTAALANFLKIWSSKFGIERERLYQLVKSAEEGYYLRDTQKQLEIGLFLKAFPYPFNQVGSYHEAISLYRNNQDEKARIILENVAEKGPSRYRLKALLSLSAIAETQGKFDEALKLRVASCSLDYPLTFIEAQRGIAILRSFAGDHQRAIQHLENLLPMAKSVSAVAPSLYPLHLNSLAVEFSEVGRIKEAKAVSNLILAFPASNRFPEVIETVREIYLKSRPPSRSIVSFREVKDNLLTLPTYESPVVESPPAQPAKVFNLAEWKEKMVKEPNGKTDESDENLDAMDGKELLLKLLQITTKEDIDEDYLREIVKFAVERSPNKNKTDKK